MAITAINNINKPCFTAQSKIKDVQITSNPTSAKTQSNQKTKKHKTRDALIQTGAVLCALALLVLACSGKGSRSGARLTPKNDTDITFIPWYDDFAHDFDAGDFG